MPISLQCECGKSLRVKDEFAGKKARCPACSAVLPVPTPDETPDLDLDLVDDSPRRKPEPARSSRLSPSRRENADDMPASRRRSAPDRDEEDDRPSRSKRRPALRDDEDDDDRPSRSKPRRRSSSGGGSSGINGGAVFGGLGLMLLSVVLFVVFLVLGWIVPYFAFLFIAGIVMVFNGLRGQS